MENSCLDYLANIGGEENHIDVIEGYDLAAEITDYEFDEGFYNRLFKMYSSNTWCRFHSYVFFIG